MTAEPLLVRLRAYSPKAGLLSKKRTVYVGVPPNGRWLSFDGPRWYEVTADVADRLARIRQDTYSETSPLVFEVRRRSEAEALELNDRRAAAAREAKERPTVATATDLTSVLSAPTPQAEVAAARTAALRNVLRESAGFASPATATAATTSTPPRKLGGAVPGGVGPVVPDAKEQLVLEPTIEQSPIEDDGGSLPSPGARRRRRIPPGPV